MTEELCIICGLKEKVHGKNLYHKFTFQKKCTCPVPSTSAYGMTDKCYRCGGVL